MKHRAFNKPRDELSKYEIRRIDNADDFAARAWTEKDYERVRQASIALVRSHHSHELQNGDILCCVSGRLFWQLLSALDRVGPHET